MYEYSRHRITKEKLCSMKRQTFRLFCCILLVVVCVVLVIILAAILTRKPAKLDTNDSTTKSPICTEYVQRPLTVNPSSIHSRCEKLSSLTDECTVTEQTSLMSYSENSTVWNQLKNLLKEEKEFSSLIVSPPMTLTPESCSLQVSFDLLSNSSVQVYLNSSKMGLVSFNVTSDQCHYGVITDRSLLEKLNLFRLVIISKDVLTNNVTYSAVTSHQCVEFATIKQFSTTSENPRFETVPTGEQNLCSMEIEMGEITCDWFNVIGLSNNHFQTIDGHPCISKGVENPLDPHAPYFLSLTSTEPSSKYFIISPIVQGGTTHSRISFWYIAQCLGSNLRFFHLQSHHDVNGIATGDISPVVELSFVNKTYRWTHQVVEIPIPTSYSSYHIVIEATVSGNSTCAFSECDSPTRPLLALDEISVETRFDQCDTSNSFVDFIDCSFDNSTDNALTTCHWQSSFPAVFDPNDPDVSLFYHWKVDSEGNDDVADHGALDQHFEGRGYVVTLTGVLGTAANYFQTPFLVANSQCSCHMNFNYLLRGLFAPRLLVSIFVNDTESNLLPQWSAVGNQGEDWLEGDALLNLPTSAPFRIQFTAQAVIDGKSEVNIDDITFTNCDFRLYDRSTG